MDGESIAVELLKKALELFGEICEEADIESEEWIWRWQVRYFLEGGNDDRENAR